MEGDGYEVKRSVCVLGEGTARVISQGKVEKLIEKELITQNPDGKFTIIDVLHKKMPLFTALLTALPEEMRLRILEDSKPDIKTVRKIETLGLNIYIPFTTWQDWAKGRDLSRISIGGISFESETMDKSLFSSHSLPIGSRICMKIDTPFKEEGERRFIKDEENSRILGGLPEDVTIFMPEGLKEPLNT